MPLGSIPEARAPREDQLERDEEFAGKRSILIAIDHGKTSLNALNWAIDNFVTHTDRVHVVHVLSHDAAGEHESIMYNATQLLFDNLSKLAHRKGKPHVSFSIKYGEAGKELCAEASRIKAIAIVMGNRGLSRVKSFIIGSTTEHILRHGGIPLLVVPHDYQAEGSEDAASSPATGSA